MMLLLKAKLRGDTETGDLFATPVPVKGHMRGQTYVAPTTAIRHKAAPSPALVRMTRHAPTETITSRSKMVPTDQVEAERARGWRTGDEQQSEPDPAERLAQIDRHIKARAKAGEPPLPKLAEMRDNLAAEAQADAPVRPFTIDEKLERLHARRNGLPVPGDEPTDPFAHRMRYDDGRLIPLDGERVFQSVAGPFGMPAVLSGVVRGKMVDITGANAVVGSTSRKRDRLTEHWTVVGDPELARRKAAREAAERAKADAAQAERDAEEARIAALAAERGTLDPATVEIGDVVESPEGEAWLVAEKFEGQLYGHPMADEDTHAGGLGDLRGWRRTDQVAPEGVIVQRYRGDSLRSDDQENFRREGRGWRPVVWDDEAHDYRPAGKVIDSLRTVSPGTEFNRKHNEAFEAREAIHAKMATATWEQVEALAEGARALSDKMETLARDHQAGLAAQAGLKTSGTDVQRELEDMRARLARYDARGASKEPLAAIYRARLSANPEKWKPGQGVSYGVVANGRYAQRNRGFRVVGVDPAGLRLAVRQVADTGFADARPGSGRDQWVWMGDAKRETAHDL